MGNGASNMNNNRTMTVSELLRRLFKGAHLAKPEGLPELTDRIEGIIDALRADDNIDVEDEDSARACLRWLKTGEGHGPASPSRRRTPVEYPVAEVINICRNGYVYLKDWEKRFILSLMGFSCLSERQFSTLRRIARKFGVKPSRQP
jgi:hypothetical protein